MYIPPRNYLFQIKNGTPIIMEVEWLAVPAFLFKN